MTVAPFPPAQACDVFVTGICIRDAGALPDIAVDRNTGVLYAVWQDGRISGLGASNVMIAASSDGGFTWTAPIPITESQVYQHFLPTVAVNDNGVIGILFYDFRSDRFTNRSLSPGYFIPVKAVSRTDWASRYWPRLGIGWVEPQQVFEFPARPTSSRPYLELRCRFGWQKTRL